MFRLLVETSEQNRSKSMYGSKLYYIEFKFEYIKTNTFIV